MVRKVLYVSGLLATITSFSANADSILRIKCDDQDVDAEVYINGKFVGNCPLDAPAPEGMIQLRARKIVNGDYEKLFEKQLRVVDGVAQRVELIMSAPQLTAEAKRRKEEAEASAQLRAAEAGDIAAMRKVADYFDAGMGVEKNPWKAKAWRDKAEAATAQGVLRAAYAGDIQAMLNMAARYEAGQGVNKNISEAQSWRSKANAAQREKLEQEKAREKQQKLDQVSFFQNTKDLSKMVFRDSDFIPGITSLPISIVYGLFFDLTSAPSKSTEVNQIKNEAALRPSTWGKPDSMIAKASDRYKANSAIERMVVTAQ